MSDGYGGIERIRELETKLGRVEEERDALRAALEGIQASLEGNDDMRPEQTLMTLDAALAMARAALSVSHAPVCETCGDTGWHTFNPPVGAHDANQTEPCPDCSPASHGRPTQES